jgi:hypothetical protein
MKNFYLIQQFIFVQRMYIYIYLYLNKKKPIEKEKVQKNKNKNFSFFFAYIIKQYRKVSENKRENEKLMFECFCIILSSLRPKKKDQNKCIEPMTKRKRKRYLLYIVQITECPWKNY